MITEATIMQLLEDVGAVITGSHFVYTSGRHGSVYINKDAVYPRTDRIALICQVIAEHFADKSIEVVIGPALGGIIISQWTAHYLSKLTKHEIFAVYAEKGEGEQKGEFVIKRGYDRLIAKRNILVVEDIITTGGSVTKVVEAVRACGGKVAGVAVLCNRGNLSAADLGDVPELFSLTNIRLETWAEDDCPLCRMGVPINIDVGKGRAYLASKQEANS